jgi:hypothetical protein
VTCISSGGGTHSANFDKKVHKPQYWTLLIARERKKAKHSEKQSNYFLDSEELQGTHKNSLDPFNSKLTTLNIEGRFVNLSVEFSPLCGIAPFSHSRLSNANTRDFVQNFFISLFLIFVQF